MKVKSVNLAVVLVVLVALFNGCSLPEEETVPVTYSVTGTVMMPALYFSLLQQAKRDNSLLEKILMRLFPTAYANITGYAGDGLVAVPFGTEVKLYRLSYDPVSGELNPPVALCGSTGAPICPTTADNGSFTLDSTYEAHSSLVLQVDFNDPNGEQTIMRAMVYGDQVDITPVSEATAQIIIEALNIFVDFNNFTVNEIGALVNLIEDEDIDITDLNFDEAIAYIKLQAGDVLSRFIVGFQEAGELKVANNNDVFHVMELEASLLEPNATVFPYGATEYYASLGGAVSFDSDGKFQSGSAIYYWGLRKEFGGTDWVAPNYIGESIRLFDNALVEDDYNPALPNFDAYLTYGRDIGFRGIVVADNGLVVANSNTEKTTFGFLTNDGGLLALLSESNDETVGSRIYNRGLRILMKKWRGTTEKYNDAFKKFNDPEFFDETFDLDDGISDWTDNTNAATSEDLNAMMNQRVYNMIMYQHYLDVDGFEVGIASGTWLFDTSSQVVPSDNSTFSTAKLHGSIITESMTVDAIKYRDDIGFVIHEGKDADGVGVKLIDEPCPNLFVIEDGGSILLRRDLSPSGFASCKGNGGYIFAGTGAVSSNGEVLIVPQIFDDIERETELNFTIVGETQADGGEPAGRRGWYIGVSQQSNFSTDNITGRYHVVGQITHLDGGANTLRHETLYGSLQFAPKIDLGLGDRRVSGILHSKSSSITSIIKNDTVGSSLDNPNNLARTKSLTIAVNGTYQASQNGTVTFTLPGTTDTVTGAAGQMLTLEDGTQIAMFLAFPVMTNSTNAGSRGILLLAHEFILNYPIPPIPPGPPPPPDDTPPIPPANTNVP